MVYQKGNLVLIFVILMMSWLEGLEGVEHRVGDSAVWSIPENKDFYSNWSINHSFHVADTLVFDFQSEFHNVMQVSRREYDACTAENPFQEFLVGPATITLIQEGVYYFICSFANYCNLGQKLSITVQPTTSPPLPASSPPPPSFISQPPAQVSHVDPTSPVGLTLSTVTSLMSTRISSASVVCSTCFVFGWDSILSVAAYIVLVF